MGMQQMSMNLGMALGPILGSALFQINLYVPMLWLLCFEVCVLALNFYAVSYTHLTLPTIYSV